MSDAIYRNEEGNFVVTAPDGHEVEVRPALTKPTVRFKNVKRPPLRRIEYIDGGHHANINAADFDAKIHREPQKGAATALTFPVAPVTAEAAALPTSAPEDVEPFDFREQDLTSLVAIIADADADAVDEIEAYEKNNKGRKTALKAVADRRAELDKE